MIFICELCDVEGLIAEFKSFDDFSIHSIIEHNFKPDKEDQVIIN